MVLSFCRRHFRILKFAFPLATDTQILLDIVKYVQKLGKTAPFADSVAEQTTPDPSAQTDEQLIS